MSYVYHVANTASPTVRTERPSPARGRPPEVGASLRGRSAGRIESREFLSTLEVAQRVGEVAVGRDAEQRDRPSAGAPIVKGVPVGM